MSTQPTETELNASYAQARGWAEMTTNFVAPAIIVGVTALIAGPSGFLAALPVGFVYLFGNLAKRDNFYDRHHYAKHNSRDYVASEYELVSMKYGDDSWSNRSQRVLISKLRQQNNCADDIMAVKKLGILHGLKTSLTGMMIYSGPIKLAKLIGSFASAAWSAAWSVPKIMFAPMTKEAVEKQAKKQAEKQAAKALANTSNTPRAETIIMPTPELAVLPAPVAEVEPAKAVAVAAAAAPIVKTKPDTAVKPAPITRAAKGREFGA